MTQATTIPHMSASGARAAIARLENVASSGAAKEAPRPVSPAQHKRALRESGIGVVNAKDVVDG